jgi:drug/metabolite transporter (DMT)-like permease
MNSLAFALILFSGLMHALYNLLIKQSRDKTAFIWWLFVCSTVLFTAVLALLPVTFPSPDRYVILLGASGGFCFVLYHLFTGRAYRTGDLSVVYPLTQTAMFYIPLWGVWLYGERLSRVGLCGVLCVAGGAYLLQLRRLTLPELLRPLGNLVDQSVRTALAAGFVYSLGAIVDKTGVSSYSPLHFTYILVLFMLAFMTVNLLRPCHRASVGVEWRNSRWLILAGGPLMMGSFLSFRYGLALAPMSYAIPVRQASVPFGVLAGVLFLGESCGRIRFIAAIVMLAGICLIRFG